LNPELVLIPFGSECLALSPQEFASAIERGRSLFPAATEKSPAERWLDAEEMEKETGIPSSWWLEQARRNAIPHLAAGKYRRFLLSEATQALKHRPKDVDQRIGNPQRLKNAR